MAGPPVFNPVWGSGASGSRRKQEVQRAQKKWTICGLRVYGVGSKEKMQLVVRVREETWLGSIHRQNVASL